MGSLSVEVRFALGQVEGEQGGLRDGKEARREEGARKRQNTCERGKNGINGGQPPRGLPGSHWRDQVSSVRADRPYTLLNKQRKIESDV